MMHKSDSSTTLTHFPAPPIHVCTIVHVCRMYVYMYVLERQIINCSCIHLQYTVCISLSVIYLLIYSTVILLYSSTSILH